jgi:hypothetical protein
LSKEEVMLDSLFDGFANGVGSPQRMNPWDQMRLASDLTEMSQYASEGALGVAQNIAAQRQQHAMGQSWDAYLQHIDGTEQTTFRGDAIASLEVEVLRAEQDGWRQLWG